MRETVRSNMEEAWLCADCIWSNQYTCRSCVLGYCRCHRDVNFVLLASYCVWPWLYNKTAWLPALRSSQLKRTASPRLALRSSHLAQRAAKQRKRSAGRLPRRRKGIDANQQRGRMKRWLPADATENRLGQMCGGAAFLAALLPMYMPYRFLGFDMTGVAGSVAARLPLVACLLCAFAVKQGESGKPWWALLSIPLAFPNAIGYGLAFLAWTINGFAP